MLLSCGTEIIDYIVKADYIYVNETDATVEVLARFSFTISPGDTHKIAIVTSSGSAKDITADDYLPPFLEAVVRFDGIRCDTLQAGSKAGKGEGAAGIDHYESRKIDKRYYEFTYRFTDVDYQRAEECD